MSTQEIEYPAPSSSMKPTPQRKSTDFLKSPPFSYFRGSNPHKARTLSATSSSDITLFRESQPLSSPELKGFSPIVASPSSEDKEFFPRSTTPPSDSSTFVNPSNPVLTLRQLSKSGSSSDTEVHSPFRSIQISGITVFLSEEITVPVSARFLLNSTEVLKLPFKQGGITTAPLQWGLQPSFTMQANTSLVVQLRKRGWPKNPIVAQACVAYGEVAEVLPSDQDDVTTYQLIIHEDPVIIVHLVADADPLRLNLQMAADKMRGVKSALDHLGRSRRFLEHIIAYGAAMSEIHPIAKAVLYTIGVAYNHLQEHEKCDRTVTFLAESMGRTLGYVEDVEQFARLGQLKKALEDIRPLMENTANFILRYLNRSRSDKTFKTSFFRDEVELLRKKYDKFQQQFDRGIAVQATGSVEAILQRLTSTDDDQYLQTLKPKGLDFITHPFGGCMKGTRLGVLSTVDEWVHDFDAYNILWIKGYPGVGKTTIASSVVTQLRDATRLGSRFAFQRDQEALSTPNALWRSVAYDLARLYPSVRKVVVERIREEDVDVETSNVKGLFHELVEEPLRACTDIPVGRLPVTVIDALDECGGRDGRQSIHRSHLLYTIKRWSTLPRAFKLIVTSRDEDDLSRLLTPSICETIDLSTGLEATEDIRLYLTRRFAQISAEYESLAPDWPGAKVVEQLTARAAGLFVWAKTAGEFVSLGEPAGQLRQIMDGVGFGDLGQLYARVLEVSFRHPSEEVRMAFQDTVGAMIFAKRPLTLEDCLRLLPYSPLMLEFIRKGLRSVLDEGGVLRFRHQSFVDFLLNSGRCPVPFRIQEQAQHGTLARVTLRVMLEDLKFNICDFPDSHLKNTAVMDLELRAQVHITSPLQYASRFWMDHVKMVPFDTALLDSIKRLLYERLLYWFEVLSIVGEIYSADDSLDALLEWVEPSGDVAFTAFIEDAIKFFDAFATPMSQSAPHIYISALPFAPETSLVAQQYRPHFPRTIQITRGRSAGWPRMVFNIDEHDKVVNCVAFSADGKLIVSASGDGTVRVWDAETGDPTCGPMEGHEGYVVSAAFSPDRRVIASGSDDWTVRLWDAETGEVVAGPLRAHSNVLSCVTFSPRGGWLASASHDGLVRLWDMGRLADGPTRTLKHPAPVTTIAYSTDGAKIVSGSVDRMVRVWDVSTGEVINGPFESHASSINSVVFSPDGTTFASASDDETIQLWDLVNNRMIGEPMEGHTDAVTSIAFSHDGRRLISGAHDGILLLWDVETAAILCQFTGHHNGVTSVAFSPDGKRVLSGSCDETIAVWDAESCDAELELAPILSIPAHQDNVKSVSFSPDGRRIASGSDDETMRVWDAESGAQLPIGFHREDLDSHHWYRFPLPATHKQGVEVVAYSPNGTLIASGGGHNDETICIWHSETGKLHVPVLRGHSGGITSVVWFPDNLRLASSSYDDSIRIWNIDMGVTIVGPYAPHESWVTSLAISPNGSRLASAGRDRSIHVLDAETLQAVGAPLVGHDGAVNCVIFTHGGLLASGSNDRTVRLWNPDTGDVVWKLEDVHNNFILSLAVSPDGRYIASASRDKTIQIWEVETGRLHLGPLEGHTGAIFSVTFNHDGTRLASSSEDETIRVWDVSSRHIDSDLADARPAEFADDSGYQNGWIERSRKDGSNSLLLWVPPWSRSGVWWPRNTAVIAEVPVKLDLELFSHGIEWHRCVEPPNEWV